MNGRGDSSDNTAISAHKMLSSVSTELRSLTEMCDKLQFDLSELLKENNDAKSLKVYQLQNLDHITQMLSGLCAYMDVIASVVPDEWTIDAEKAAQAILLADLAARLSSGSEDVPSPTTDVVSGDCSFF